MNDAEQRALRMLIDGIEGWWEGGILDMISEEAHNAIENRLMAVRRGWCETIGHDVVQDHCGMPEHDYCMTCQQRRPGEAAR